MILEYTIIKIRFTGKDFIIIERVKKVLTGGVNIIKDWRVIIFIDINLLCFENIIIISFWNRALDNSYRMLTSTIIKTK